MGNTRDRTTKMRSLVQTIGLIRKFQKSPVDGANFLDSYVALVPIINLEKCGPPSSNSHEIRP